MKTLTIIPSDSVVIIDGVARRVDLSGVPLRGGTVHAVQWDAEREQGYIEFIDDDPNDSIRPANEALASITEFQLAVAAWEAAAPSPPPSMPGFIARDLVALLSPEDYAAIQTAVAQNPALGLLWSSLLVQGEVPIQATAERFLAGWAGLKAAIGEERASAIGRALGIPEV